MRIFLGEQAVWAAAARDWAVVGSAWAGWFLGCFLAQASGAKVPPPRQAARSAAVKTRDKQWVVRPGQGRSETYRIRWRIDAAWRFVQKRSGGQTGAAVVLVPEAVWLMASGNKGEFFEEKIKWDDLPPHGQGPSAGRGAS